MVYEQKFTKIKKIKTKAKVLWFSFGTSCSSIINFEVRKFLRNCYIHIFFFFSAEITKSYSKKLRKLRKLCVCGANLAHKMLKRKIQQFSANNLATLCFNAEFARLAVLAGASLLFSSLPLLSNFYKQQSSFTTKQHKSSPITVCLESAGKSLVFAFFSFYS